MSFAVVLTLIIAIFLAVTATRSSVFKVERSATMKAPAEEIFALINDFHKWQGWSPWAKLDPSAIYQFGGPDSGNGANFSWSGNKMVGAGSMSITESRPHEYIRIRLDFTKPLPSTNQVEFTLRTEGEDTIVNWSMRGTNNFLAKFISMFVNCERMVGKMYEQGLSNIRSIVEKP